MIRLADAVLVIVVAPMLGCARSAPVETAMRDRGFGDPEPEPVIELIVEPIVEPIVKPADRPQERGNEEDAAPQQVAPQPGAQAEELLRKADEVRNPQMDYTVQVKVTSVRPKRKPYVSTYEVLVKGREKTVIRTLSPASEQGRVLLMNGTALWAFMPNLSKPLRISLQERLIGEVANGDLARTNFSGDYEPMLLRTEEQEHRRYHVLELLATNGEVTYARVILWVEDQTARPVRAQFYALSGRLLKTAWYDRYEELGGRERPTRLTIRDAINEQQFSVIEYTSMRLGELPEKYFTKDHMKKLME